MIQFPFSCYVSTNNIFIIPLSFYYFIIILLLYCKVYLIDYHREEKSVTDVYFSASGTGLLPGLIAKRVFTPT